MEDYKDQFITILAGYEQEMEWFLSTNPGLPSRFPIHIRFPDYDAASLLRIARQTAAKRQYRLSADAEIKLRRQINQTIAQRSDKGDFSNARWVRNIIERAVRQQAVRLYDIANPKREDLLTLEGADFVWEGKA